MGAAIRKFSEEDREYLIESLEKIGIRTSSKRDLHLADNGAVVAKSDDQTSPIYAIVRYEYLSEDGWGWVLYGTYSTLRGALSRARRLK